MDVRSARQPFEPIPGRVEHPPHGRGRPPLRRRGDAPGGGAFDRILDLEPIGPMPLPSPGNPAPRARADGKGPAHRGTLIDIRV